jgi:hypothetical protein
MNKYLINMKSLKNYENHVFCVDDYGVEGEIKPNKWYKIIEQDDRVYSIKNEWDEVETYSKKRFRIQKENYRHE